MANKIQLTPAELESQAAEMEIIASDLSTLFNNFSSVLNNVNSNWSKNLANNFAAKILFAQRTYNSILTDLENGAKVARTCALTFESVDSELAKLYQNNESSAKTDAQMSEKPKEVDIKKYCDKVTDAEYAKLCKLTYDALDAKDPKKAIIDIFSSELPENDPLRNVTQEQINVIESFSGFSAITIADGDNVIVIFAGTNDPRDFITDAKLTFGNPSVQSTQANAMIHALSKKYDNIVVTGHSLGGYLATSTTLYNSSVSKCIAFDPPGRYDTLQQSLFNKDNYSKITTYEANGSLISKVGISVGDVERLNVKENGGALSHNHGIQQISDALDKNEAIKNSWK